MKSSEVLPVAEELFAGLDSAEVTIFDWDYPIASVSAKIQTYRGDFFEQFTRNPYFRITGMHNLKTTSDEWFMEIQFTKMFEQDAVPLYWEKTGE